jgi:hypothetical protein
MLAIRSWVVISASAVDDPTPTAVSALIAGSLSRRATEGSSGNARQRAAERGTAGPVEILARPHLAAYKRAGVWGIHPNPE